MLLWSLCRGEGERGVTYAVRGDGLNGGKLWSLEGGRGSKGPGWVASKVGLSVTSESASTVAIAAAVASTGPIASILCVCAKFIWSVVKPSTIIPIPKTAKITPSRGIPIPVPEITTSASP